MLFSPLKYFSEQRKIFQVSHFSKKINLLFQLCFIFYMKPSKFLSCIFTDNGDARQDTYSTVWAGESTQGLCIVRSKNTFSLQLTLTSDLLRSRLYWNFCFDSSEICLFHSHFGFFCCLVLFLINFNPTTIFSFGNHLGLGCLVKACSFSLQFLWLEVCDICTIP